MHPNRLSVWIYGFALFSLFFGAGNLILPPQLGLLSGSAWSIATIGFCVSAVVVPMLGILAHARLQGGLMDFGKKISPGFSLVFAALVYGVSLALAAPRTAAVVHELTVAPYFSVPTWGSSFVYFGVVYLVVIHRAGITNLLGKWLTPVLLLVLLMLIVNVLMLSEGVSHAQKIAFPFVFGILEGYQTFDAIGSVVAGGVLLVSMQLEYPKLQGKEKFQFLWRAGLIAGISLLILYAGLAFSGAASGIEYGSEFSRTDLLSEIIRNTLGTFGGYVLSLLIALACFTTAVGIVAGSADFVKSRLQGSENTFKWAALLGSLLGVGIGQLPVALIITIGFPVLKIIYPLTIALILINAFPERFFSVVGLRIMVGITLVFSLPELLVALGMSMNRIPGWHGIPLMEHGLGWLLPFGATLLLNVFWHLWNTFKKGQKMYF